MKKTALLLLTLICLVLYALTARGNIGIPTVEQIKSQHYKYGSEFETSQEGSRYGLLLSMVNDRAINIDRYAFLGTPDVGYINGHYYSLFPPTLSFIAMPLYILGLKLGATQLAVFSVSSIFGFLTMVMIYIFGLKLKLHWSISLFSALAFGFATNAWGYSVTLYAHSLSAFLLTTSALITFFWTKRAVEIRNLLFWLMYGIAVYLDYPNLGTFLPLALVLTFQGISIQKHKRISSIHIDWRYVIAPILFIGMLICYGYYNQLNFGNPLQLSNSLPKVTDAVLQGQANIADGKDEIPPLTTRNLLEGLRSFTISLDRGVLFFSPIVLFFLFGLGQLKQKLSQIEATFLATVGINIVLYSMFGDPYGGWAFGSRYLIAIFPLLLILAGVGLQRYSRSVLIKLAYSAVFIYSCAVSLLAPLTTNVIPPYSEARPFGLDFTYMAAEDMLVKGKMNSFVYNHVIKAAIDAPTYYGLILAFVSVIALTLIWWRRKYEFINS